MPCGCNKKTKYVVVHLDGKQETVDTLTAAMTAVRKSPGAKYTRIKV